MSPLSIRKSWRATVLACYNGYVVQAICVNLAPLFFLLFQRRFGITLSQLSALIAVNFSLQLAIDFLASRIGDRISPRVQILISHLCACFGLIGLSVLPRAMDPFWGLVIPVSLLGIGGGLIEVMISPLVEACPTEGKSRNMSLLHSFYSWGQASVVFLSGLWFLALDIDVYWFYLPLLWAVIPFVGFIAFCLVPIYRLPTVRESGMTAKKLFSMPVFLLLLVMMIGAGAAEQCMSQWASNFAEAALGVPKTLGDMLGPGTFALAMAFTRVFCGKLSEKIRPTVQMTFCASLCVAAYLLAALATPAWAALLGCMLCGASVGIFWPGILSLAAGKIPGGGISMFAVLALAGDVGCLTGPALAGKISDLNGGDLRVGFLFSILFPALELIALFLLTRHRKAGKEDPEK